MRKLSLAIILLGFMAGPAFAQQTIIDVKKSPTCGCCSAWVKRLQAANFDVRAQNLARDQLRQYKIKSGITRKYASCHTARVGGYTIEGHVPMREIRRLLREKPDAIGLAVPGMPLGSPGMDYGTEREAYDVLLINKDGSASVFASYAARQ